MTRSRPNAYQSGSTTRLATGVAKAQESALSKQVNFFADAVDSRHLHETILRLFPGLMAIWTTHGTADALEPARVAEPDDLSGKTEKMLLVPEWARHRLTFHYVKDIASPVFTVAMRENPVIEYRPCIMLQGGNCIRTGRLYWAYGGELPREDERRVSRLLSWVRSRSRRIRRDESFRIMPHAAETAGTLDFLFDIVHPNPYRNEKVDIHKFP
jgi:hypothetical protein